MVSRRLALLPCALLLSACGAGAQPGADAERAPDGPEQVREHEARPVPEGEGGDVPDDVNGDGFTDLLFTSAHGQDVGLYGTAERLVIVYGSPEGPDPTTRTVWNPDAVRPTVSAGDGGAGNRPGTADLDGDGFADIPVAVPGDGGSDAAAIVWGGPAGPDPQAPPTPLPLDTGEARDPSTSPSADTAIGDFDGDGAADMVVARTWVNDGPSPLSVLYGPFGRDGAPSRTAQGSLEASLSALVSAPPRTEGGTSPLLARHAEDGEQAGNTLVVTAAGDPALWEAVELLPGSLAAFGDLDGDGETDLALADSGGRNNEPGFETEAPEVDRRVNVYPGPLTAEAADPLSAELPSGEPAPGYGASRAVVACDLDGDGTDELAVGTAGRGVDLLRLAGGGIEADGTDPLVRRGPESGPIGAGEPRERVAAVASCGDHDADGGDELALSYDHGDARPAPVRWWITDGRGGDGSSFDSAAF